MNFVKDLLTIILGLLGAMFFFFMEIFVIPGFGIMGILGIVILALTVFIAYKSLGYEAAFYTILAGLVIGASSLYYFFKKKLFKRTTLQYKLSKEDGFAVRHFLAEEFMDKEGTALTNLRPVGIIEIDNERLDAVAEGDTFIKKGSKIKVVGIEGNKLVVQKIEEV
jgi:membrane-bound serine protease (ClpP class)